VEDEKTHTKDFVLHPELLTSGLLMTSVSWGLKQLLGTQKMITIQAFVLNKQENKECWLREEGEGQTQM